MRFSHLIEHCGRDGGGRMCVIGWRVSSLAMANERRRVEESILFHGCGFKPDFVFGVIELGDEKGDFEKCIWLHVIVKGFSSQYVGYATRHMARGRPYLQSIAAFLFSEVISICVQMLFEEGSPVARVQRTETWSTIATALRTFGAHVSGKRNLPLIVIDSVVKGKSTII